MLKAPGDQPEAANAAPVELLVCGGTAMNLRGVTARATKELDVVAVVSREARPAQTSPRGSWTA
jgi:hypothetical protein